MKPSDKAKYLSVLLKLIVILAAAVGIYRTATAGRGSFMGGSRVFMFFTIQSNIAVALICAVGLWLLFRHTPPKTVWYVIQFVGAVSITLTGVVFAFVLAPTLGSHAWNVQNVLTHVVVPVAAVADFFVTGVYGTLQKRHIPLVTFLKGVRYPYFFLNWGSPAGAFGFTRGLPFMGTVWWILAILVFLLGIGYGYLAILDLLKKRM